MLRIRYGHHAGAILAISIERLADGLFYDFSTLTFVANPASPLGILPERTGIWKGSYAITMPSPEAQFTDKDYSVCVHDRSTNYQVTCILGCTMKDGDDLTYFAPSLAA